MASDASEPSSVCACAEEAGLVFDISDRVKDLFPLFAGDLPYGREEHVYYWGAFVACDLDRDYFE